MHSESDWSKAGRQFQQTLGETWAKDLQLPSVRFDTDKLMALQKAYLTEAAELWNSGLGAKPAGADKRFAGDAWASNPISAYTAANYLLNARTLLGLAEAA